MIDFNKWWQRRERHLYKMFGKMDASIPDIVHYAHRVARDAYKQGRADERAFYFECMGRKEQP